ncbi:hypothetical protein MICA_2326 [Micavibrio aeruginosavorus ARL-13]|uniref:Uncharacterized protein n=1 Tax=Micavibrio aeruginosavorus (strain ARL-13) TaxID=856793 RepID=G2KT84_MICAA|nr:hypothetical protein MICA_2326 [Micavibrio aeruginosavorus ARL-13]
MLQEKARAVTFYYNFMVHRGGKRPEMRGFYAVSNSSIPAKAGIHGSGRLDPRFTGMPHKAESRKQNR